MGSLQAMCAVCLEPCASQFTYCLCTPAQTHAFPEVPLSFVLRHGLSWQDHLTGKQYMGWKAIRDKLTEIQEKQASQRLPPPPGRPEEARPAARDRDRERSEVILRLHRCMPGSAVGQSLDICFAPCLLCQVLLIRLACRNEAGKSLASTYPGACVCTCLTVLLTSGMLCSPVCLQCLQVLSTFDFQAGRQTRSYLISAYSGQLITPMLYSVIGVRPVLWG